MMLLTPDDRAFIAALIKETLATKPEVCQRIDATVERFAQAERAEVAGMYPPPKGST